MQIIKKPKSYFKVPPNLVEYEKAYKSFLWKNSYPELSWSAHGRMNAAYNAVDRHLNTWRKNKIALYWEAEDGREEKFSFEELAEKSSQYGNYLKSLGVKRGDRVFIFLPRIPELYLSFLAILKIAP